MQIGCRPLCLAADYLFNHRIYAFYFKAVALIALASIVGLSSLETMVRLICGTEFAPSIRHPSKVGHHLPAVLDYFYMAGSSVQIIKHIPICRVSPPSGHSIRPAIRIKLKADRLLIADRSDEQTELPLPPNPGNDYGVHKSVRSVYKLLYQTMAALHRMDLSLRPRTARPRRETRSNCTSSA